MSKRKVPDFPIVSVAYLFETPKPIPSRDFVPRHVATSSSREYFNSPSWTHYTIDTVSNIGVTCDTHEGSSSLFYWSSL